MITTQRFLALAVAILCYGTSCDTPTDPTPSEPKPSPVLLKGTILNGEGDPLTLVSERYYNEYELSLEQDSLFNDTLFLPEGYYSINRTMLYLKPGFDLTITRDVESDTWLFEGAGAKENQFLRKKEAFNASLKDLQSAAYKAASEEDVLFSLLDSIYQAKQGFLRQATDLDQDFVFLEEQSLKYEHLGKISRFEAEKRYMAEEGFYEPSERYLAIFEGIDLTDERLLLVGYYIDFINSYINYKKDQASETAGTEEAEEDIALAFAQTVDATIESRPLKEALFYRVGTFMISYSKDVDQVYAIIRPAFENEFFVKEVEDYYQDLNKTKKGSVSPSFTFEGMDGAMHSLEEFKGKLVYIDVWGSWCAPCMAEVPHLKELEENLKGKDIVFVSIDVHDSKEVWQKTVQENKLGGVQLYAPEFDVAFFNDYVVQAFPRFILIDKEGKVLDRNAKRPSDPTLQEELEQYL